MVLTLASGTATVLGGHVAATVGPLPFLSVTGATVALLGGAIWIATRPVREPTVDAVAS